MFRQGLLKGGALCFPSAEEHPQFDTLVVVPGAFEGCCFDSCSESESTSTVEDEAFSKVFNNRSTLEALRRKEATVNPNKTVTMRMAPSTRKKVVKLKPAGSTLKKKPVVTLR